MKHTGFPPTAEVGGMENSQLAEYARSLLVEASKRTKEELVRQTGQSVFGNHSLAAANRRTQARQFGNELEEIGEELNFNVDQWALTS